MLHDFRISRAYFDVRLVQNASIYMHFRESGRSGRHCIILHLVFFQLRVELRAPEIGQVCENALRYSQMLGHIVLRWHGPPRSLFAFDAKELC